MYREFWALTWRELVRWGRSKATIFTSLITPILYLAIFGQALNLTRLIPPGPGAAATAALAFRGAPDFFSYFAAGMAGFVSVFGSLFVGASVIFDKRLGTIKKSLAAPVSRWSIFASRLVAGAL